MKIINLAEKNSKHIHLLYCIRAAKQREKNYLSCSMAVSHYSELKLNPCLPAGELLTFKCQHKLLCQLCGFAFNYNPS